MEAMTDPKAPTEPGERRLARPPSERYREAEGRSSAAASPPRAVSPLRGLILAMVVALGGAAVITVVGGVLALTVGLVVSAGIIGWLTAVALRFGAGSTVPARRRAWAAAAIAVGGVILGQLGLWLHAGSEGGVLPLIDYLGEVYGLLVPLQVVVAPAVAWVTAR
jgi:hypothetical protein